MLFVFVAVFAMTFYLYRFPLKAVLYPALICLALGIVALAADFIKVRSRHEKLESMRSMTAAMIRDLPEGLSIEADDLREIIMHLKEESAARETEASIKYTDMTDYYTLWAHQIKTPIASMKLTLENMDIPQARRLSQDLFRIEQYVEMVLAYMRMDSDSTDYVFRPHKLDDIIRSSVKKFSAQFIGRRISLDYRPSELEMITDDKWFSFALEQILSNALKYTPEGGKISIYVKEPKTLVVEDNGIGIAAEDLPRIFEKGYTGYNGRSDRHASGIGLYLTKRILCNLSFGITAESQPDVGTKMMIDLSQYDLRAE